MIAQYTAASLVSENKVLAHPGERRHHPDLGQPGGPRLDGLDVGAQAARGRRQRPLGARRRDPGRRPGDRLPGRASRSPGAASGAVHAAVRARCRPMDVDRDVAVQIAAVDAAAAERSSRPPRRRSVPSPSAEPLRLVRRPPGDRPGRRHRRPGGARRRRLVGGRRPLRGRAACVPGSRRPRGAAADRPLARRAGRGVVVVDRAGTSTSPGSRRIRERIAAGDVYQVNLCRVLPRRLPAGADDGRARRRCWRRATPRRTPGRSGCPRTGVEVVTASPELFLRRDGDRRRVRPDQGHRGHGRRPDRQGPGRERHDRRPGAQRPRERRRHRVGRGARAVRRRAAPGLVHLVSTVRALLRADVGWADLLARRVPARLGDRRPQVERAAPHPASSSRCRAAPTAARSAGWTPTAAGALAVGIRTFWLAGRRAALRHRSRHHLGLGPEREWDETELKARRLLAVRRRQAPRGAVHVKVWVNGTVVERPARPGLGLRPRADGRGRGVRDGQGGRRRAVRAHPAPRPAARSSARGLGLPDPDLDLVRRAVADVLAENDTHPSRSGCASPIPAG